ncbi:Protein Kr-h2 [Papilio machaon]|uniref:Protein Kr-h2 n=1 Tax=Papilio machaon TaxID=76193 RepID=A0A0N1IHP5_PAPMA|nr:Protein Kr-h2 [Papilio machaon]
MPRHFEPNSFYPSSSPVSAFYKALLANAATSALRLHQRIPPREIALSREFLARFLLEDSAHYLFYSLIFMNVVPNICILFKSSNFKIRAKGKSRQIMYVDELREVNLKSGNDNEDTA